MKKVEDRGRILLGFFAAALFVNPHEKRKEGRSESPHDDSAYQVKRVLGRDESVHRAARPEEISDDDVPDESHAFRKQRQSRDYYDSL